MTQSVKTSAFISSSAKYVKAAVEKANANGNAYLTKAEAAMLPLDLQDNFAAYRAGTSTSGGALASDFVRSYEAYVAAMASQADRTGNGILSLADAKDLPVDLQDNFETYRAGGRRSPTPKELLTASQRKAAIENRALPASSKVGEVANELDAQLGDGNIMSGVVGIASGKLSTKNPSTAEFKAFAVSLARDYALHTDDLNPGDFTASVKSSSAAMKDAVMIIAEGNMYNTKNKDLMKGILEGDHLSDPDYPQLGLKDLTDTLGSPVKAVVVRGSALPGNIDTDDAYPLGLAVFLNTKTGEFVGFYGRNADQ